ncbi:efflux RND transporter periplasmic adaptor subunit [PVC group bacterium]|nr:efflux RND transporter periplasmic adaptor subunit [PVC group bacterium]
MKSYFLNRKIIREKKCIFILCVVMMLFVVGCGNKKEDKHSGGRTINVVAFESKEEPISDKISLVGSMIANESVEIKSEIDGTIEQINFKEGQFVQETRVLFWINQKKLQAILAQAQANLKLAQTTAKRYKALVESKAVSQQEYDQAIATLEVNRATVDLSKEQLGDATIKAPFEGVMGERLVSEGQFITKGTSLGFLVSQNPMKVEFNLPERFLGKIKISQDIKIHVAAYPDEYFSGVVYFIAPRIDEQTRTVLVKATVPNPEGKLRTGMFANLDLIVDVRQKAIVIPETALVVKGDTVSVFVIDDDNSVKLRLIKTGMRLDGMVEVTEGLASHERIVTEGHQKLRNGAKVELRFEDYPS